MKTCLICNAGVEPFMSFGRQPLANGFLTREAFEREYFFELQVCFCTQCTMVQLLDQPAPEKMFNDHYAFFSGTSKLMAVHFKEFAEDIQKRFLDAKDPFVVEIGSNDGIMLRNFAEKKIRHLGIEPSANVAETARKQGVRTISRFFNEETARDIVKSDGQADAFIAANVMCHIPTLHSVVEGIRVLLKPGGIAAFEDPYLGDVLEKTSYDQFYDEHVFMFSATSIRRAFGQHGLELVDAVGQPTHGGSMRYFLAHKGSRPVSPRVAETLAKEEAMGVHRPETYLSFRRACERSREDLVALLKRLKAEKKRVVGYAATSKSTTVLNYCGVGPDLIEFISDTTPIKHGKFSPGVHVPVLPYEKFKERYPDYAILFGWNHKTEIMAKEEAFMKAGGRWIFFVPRVEVT